MDDINAGHIGDSSRGCGNFSAFSFEDFCGFVDQLGFRASGAGVPKELFETVGAQRLLSYVSFIDEHCVSSAGRSMKSLSDLVEFDSAVRSLVFKYVDTIETQLKARYAQSMLEELGEFSIMDKRNFKCAAEHRESVFSIKCELNRQKKVNAAARRQLKIGLDRIPVWLALEVSSLGTVSKLLENTKSAAVADRVAASFGVNKRCLLSWLKTISLVRNACAHFMPYVVRPQIPSVPKPVFDAEGDCTKPLYILVIIGRLLRGRVEAGYERAVQDLDSFEADVDRVLGGFAARNPELAGALRIPQRYAAPYTTRRYAAPCSFTQGPTVFFGVVDFAA